MSSQSPSDVHESPVRGDLIRQLRESFNNGEGAKPGLSRQVFATRAGLSTSTLQRAEDSEPGVTYATLASIAGVLGVPVSRIYDASVVDQFVGADVAPQLSLEQWDQLQAKLDDIARDQATILAQLDRIEGNLP